MEATVLAECRSCGATGLYRGFAEREGTAVVCLTCNGTGCEAINYAPFTERKGEQGVYTVQRSRGSMLALGVGGAGKAITYQDFKNGEMP